MGWTSACGPESTARRGSRHAARPGTQPRTDHFFAVLCDPAGALIPELDAVVDRLKLSRPRWDFGDRERDPARVVSQQHAIDPENRDDVLHLACRAAQRPIARPAYHADFVLPHRPPGVLLRNGVEGTLEGVPGTVRVYDSH